MPGPDADRILPHCQLPGRRFARQLLQQQQPERLRRADTPRGCGSFRTSRAGRRSVMPRSLTIVASQRSPTVHGTNARVIVDTSSVTSDDSSVRRSPAPEDLMAGATFRTPFAQPRLARAKSLGAALWIFAWLAPPVALPAQGLDGDLAPAMDLLPLGFCIAAPALRPAKRTIRATHKARSCSATSTRRSTRRRAFVGRHNVIRRGSCAHAGVDRRHTRRSPRPSRGVADQARVKVSRSAVNHNLRAPKGTDNPPECAAAKRARRRRADRRCRPASTHSVPVTAQAPGPGTEK